MRVRRIAKAQVSSGPRKLGGHYNRVETELGWCPALRRGLLLKQQGAAYRLTWRLVPPPGAPLPLSPLETTLTQSASLSL